MEETGYIHLHCIGNCRRRLAAEGRVGCYSDGYYICRKCFTELKLTLDDVPPQVPHEDQLRHESEIEWKVEQD